MFSKTADQTSEPAAPHGAGRSNANRSVLGPDLKITGEITSTGALEILGEVDGNITADGLIVGQNGRVSGTVNAGSVEVNGRLDGKVSSRQFVMRSAAQVAADIGYQTLVIESGAVIEGRFTRNG
ncbi:polymer-forming cytoskeletal protein [Xinfangfangia sp. D13-10-4-6]|uniref:bactofilin family protein n=1 Tax=Pseudogemmobacter hezensis TaxID=2737662 RepID=UPI00155738E1|nr:polymer-forming cytoskeletal protein [Pseudogemmobacter hezensis]NPD15687.1 polymer-forming cytoskeletal protein [Pseudogemmobacter hezensis]